MSTMKLGAALLGVFLCLPFGGLAQAQTKSAGPRHDPLVEAQLRVSFGRVDLNKDGFLDAAELAKSFRGPNAKPAPQPAFDDTGNFVYPDGQTKAKYQDQIYLLALDKDYDGQISWAEFEEYGEAYAAALRGQQLEQQRQRDLYYQAQRNFAASQLRRTTYSRYGNNRRTYYRPVRRAPAATAAHRIQDQRRLQQQRSLQQQRLLQQQRVLQMQQQQRLLQQQRVLQMQQQQRMMLLQQQRALAQRQRAIYSRQAAPVHRGVKTPPNRKRR
ncbi:MAG: hypothetical protein HYX68_11115 [Planctomycetes bacterium]|nr:hypothetical protein [Planctomycetota bacterium]